MGATTPQYYRRDRDTGVTPPDVTKTCSFAEHVVRARGKRTRYTSVSLDPNRIRDFGDQLYELLVTRLLSDQHILVDHAELLQALRAAVNSESKADRARAIQALRYATRRREALVDWRFNSAGVDRKVLINWAFPRVQSYFAKV